jgi:hypothetical protein
MTEFDLGGIGCGGPRTTVNLVPPADILCDITDVDSYCEDGTVASFLLSHTLEHIPSQNYVQFLKDLHRKLRPGGFVQIVQTDVGRLLGMVNGGQISLRAARLPIFTPADKLRENPHHQHYNFWSAAMLCDDLRVLGYRTETTRMTGWTFDQNDELFPEETRKYHGIEIPNLGVRGYK